MMPFNEQVDNWFNEILEVVDEDYIIGKWLGYLSQLNPTIQYHEISKYPDPVYRLDNWRDKTWMTDVKEKLISLEHFPH